VYRSVTFEELQERREIELDFRSMTGLFNAADCERIIGRFSDASSVKSRITWGDQSQFERSTDISWVEPNDETMWLFRKLSSTVTRLNEEFFRFSLDGNIRSFQLSRYEVGQGYDWHCDLGRRASRRKLSVSVQLSDSASYDGGDLEFFRNDNAVARATRNRGSITAFPSWAIHRVSRIREGRRWSLVGWLEGPPFK
jgi:PKHD-type hydroxylase